MGNFFRGLTFKIGIAVVSIQIVALTAIGSYYIERFSGEIDHSMQAQLQIPGELMRRGMLRYEAASDRDIVESLIGETLLDSLVIGLDGQIFYALNPADVGKNVGEVIAPGFTDGFDKVTVTSIQVPDGLINVTPLLQDGKLLGFLYLKIGTEQLRSQKNLLILVFILGSFLCVLATSIALILLFRSVILIRIEKLLSVSEQVASGNLAVRVSEPISSDEIGTLQRGVNFMAAELEQTIASLQTEIVERSRAEAALRLSEDKFSKAFYTSPDSININRMSDGLYLEVNQGFTELTGYTPEDVHGKTSLETNIWANPQDRARLVQGLREYGGINNLEAQFRLKSGEIRTGLMSARVIQVGDEPCILSITRDITDRKQAEEALRKAEEKYRNIFENSIEAITQTTPEGKYLTANPATARILGYDSPEELIVSLSDLTRQLYVEPGRREVFEHLMEEHGSITNFESEAYRKDGRTIWLSENVRAVRDSDGAIVYYEGTAVDITERKRFEAEREALIAELEVKNTELERFIYTVSHDLKSPLITIGGFTGFVEKDALAGDAERVRADMTHINDAVAKMQRLLNELLELSRIGRRANPPEEVSFEAIARDALILEHGHLAARGVEVEIAPDLPVVYGDRARLVEVMQNLVDNACKFMGNQSYPRIEIGVRQGGDGPVFFVRDNGIGIEPRYHDKVFGLFDKLDPQSEGTGVGLALVKRIIEMHGGEIWVESQLGRGATFCLTLPSSSIRQDNMQ
jgi:PAS domain S-box-containing protein